MKKGKLLFYTIYSFFWGIRYLPFKIAIKIPILIHPSVKTKLENRSSILFPNRIWRAMCSIGFAGSIGRSNCKTLINIEHSGKLIIQGFSIFSKGARIIIDGGELNIGSNFFCNGDCFFFCNKKIIIGKDNLYGWDVHFNTTDGHTFYVNGKEKDNEANIIIGNHVWIGSNCIITKNTEIADNCVIAQNSLVTKIFSNPNYLIGGIPGKEIKGNINWTF